MDQTTPMQIDAAGDVAANTADGQAPDRFDRVMSEPVQIDPIKRTRTLVQCSNRLNQSEKEFLLKLVEQGDPAVLSSIDARSTDDEIVAALQQLIYARCSPADLKVDMALRNIYKDADNKKKQAAAKSSLRHIRKLIEKVHKTPSDIKARRVFVKNFTFKKFVLDVPGASALMTEIGFATVNDEYLEMIADVDLEFLSRTMEKLDQAASDVEAAILAPSVHSGPSKPCAGNCGFFGNPDTENFCSLCYRQKLSGQNPVVGKSVCIVDGCTNFSNPDRGQLCNKCWQQREDAKNAGWSNRSWFPALQRAKLKLYAVWCFSQGRSSRPVQSDLRKCWICARKIPLTAIACRCGYVFCSKHRSTLDHECTFNFRRAHKVHLHQLNPQIQGKKFDRLD